MDLNSLYNWLVDDIIKYVIIFIVAVRMIRAVNDQRTGSAILSFVLGVVVWYFLKHSDTVLNVLGKIVAKMFGG